MQIKLSNRKARQEIKYINLLKTQESIQYTTYNNHIEQHQEE